MRRFARMRIHRITQAVAITPAENPMLQYMALEKRGASASGHR